jgi:hypothetical protein
LVLEPVPLAAVFEWQPDAAITAANITMTGIKRFID